MIERRRERKIEQCEQTRAGQLDVRVAKSAVDVSKLWEERERKICGGKESNNGNGSARPRKREKRQIPSRGARRCGMGDKHIWTPRFRLPPV